MKMKYELFGGQNSFSRLIYVHGTVIIRPLYTGLHGKQCLYCVSIPRNCQWMLIKPRFIHFLLWAWLCFIFKNGCFTIWLYVKHWIILPACPIFKSHLGLMCYIPTSVVVACIINMVLVIVCSATINTMQVMAWLTRNTVKPVYNDRLIG